MKLQEITANIRLRRTWEAIDMGFGMVREWWKAIYLPLSIVTFSIATLLFFAVPEDKFWIAGLVFWWLKPLYDRLVLHIISHKLFNEELSSLQAIKAIPSLIWNTGFFQTMTFRRFSMSRGFNLPIWQLEQLRGPLRAERQRVLHLAAHNQAAWLTIVMVHIEMIFVLSLFVLIILFVPDNILKNFYLGLFDASINDIKWIDYLNYIFYVVVITFLHPFYIAGNFALYINRRTQLEAWDIELDFRNLAIRIKNLIKSTTPLVFTCFFVLSSLAGSQHIAFADGVTSNIDNSNHKIDRNVDRNIEYLEETRQPASASKKIIEEVMHTKNLDDEKKVMTWKKKERPKAEKKDKSIDIDPSFWLKLKDFLEPAATFFGALIEYSLWILIAIGLFLLYYFRDQWLFLLQGKQKLKDEYIAPEVMFGMDVRKESLPDDIIAEVQKLWEANKPREALSLLYRGALIRLINQEKVELEDSYTEGDVLRHANKQLNTEKNNYLKMLTAQWKLIAYAHRPPAESDMQFLFTNWKSDFATNSAPSSSAPDKSEGKQ